MKKIFLNLFLILFIAGCTTPILREAHDKRSVEDVFQGTTVNKYYLSDIPTWVNYSTEGQCRRTKPIRYLNFSSLHQSFSFNYEELVQFQLMLNLRVESFLSGQGFENLRAKDESYLFSNVQDQIKSGVKEFQKNDFKKIAIIWIDHLYENEATIKELTKLLNSPKMNEKMPILASICLSKVQMEVFVSTKLNNQQGLQFISAEMFSPFKDETTLGYGYYFDPKKFFGSDYNFEVIYFSTLDTKVFGDIKLKQHK